MGKPSTSARISALSFSDIGGVRVLSAPRCFPGVAGEFNKCMEADLGSKGFERAPTSAESMRWAVLRLVL